MVGLLRDLIGRSMFWAILGSVWCLICYAPALKGPFFFDDDHFIVFNQTVHSLENIGQIYTSTTTAGAAISGNFYRPNQQFVYALIYHFVADTTPLPYHLVSLLLHIVSGILLLYLLQLIGFKTPVAGCAALFFLLHPVQTEAVAYISGLSDPLAMTFFLGALLIYTRALMRQQNPLRLLVVTPVLLLFVLALFTRESSVVFVPVAAAVTLFALLVRPSTNLRYQWGALGIFAGVALIYIVMKFSVLNFGGGFGLTDQSNIYTQHLWVRLVTFVSILWDYAVLIVYPQELFYEKPYVAYATLISWRGAFFLLLFGGVAYVMFFMRKWPRLALGVGIFGVALMPFCGIVPLNAIFLEHWLYVPMIGMAVIMAALMTAVLPYAVSRYVLLLCGVAALGLMSLRTYARAAQWANVESFYLGEIDHGGSSMRVLNNLGMYYAGHGQFDKAISYYQKAADGDLPLPQPHHNLANIYVQAGRLPDALKELKLALTIDHQFIYSLNFLDKIFTTLGDQPRTLMVRQAIEAVNMRRGYDFAEFSRVVFEP